MENKEVDTCKLLYNTERVTLYIPEYGRNVQKMVDYLKTIEDRQKRNEQARAIMKVMEIINPAVHHQDDYEHKLWTISISFPDLTLMWIHHIRLQLQRVFISSHFPFRLIRNL